MSRWYIAILLYLILVCLLLAFRPNMLFQPDKDYKRWSVHRSETTSIFSIMFAFPVLAILSYYLSALFFVIVG